jgi:hypothetical protein
MRSRLVEPGEVAQVGEGLSDGEGAVLLVYLVDEEKDIYIGVLVVVCHLEPAGRVLSNIRHRHSTATSSVSAADRDVKGRR